jgi:nucleoside-diphosphate-sugar epimerase
MKILIAGCGYLGTHAGKRFLAKGHRVYGLRRRPAALEATGIEPVTADLLDPATLEKLPEADIVVACQAPGEKDDYGRTYVEGTKNLLRALEKRPPKKFVLVSSTRVYGQRDGSWIDETTDPSGAGYEDEQDEKRARNLLKTERLVRQSGIPFVILRLSGLYGPGRHRLRAIREGRVKPAANDQYSNRVRVEDAAAALAAVLQKGAPGEVYLASDDAPCTHREFYAWILPKLGLPAAAEGRTTSKGKRCKNEKLKTLGFKCAFPSFKEGYEELLEEGI